MLTAAFGVTNVFIQIVIFLVTSFALLLATRPLVRKHINKKSQPTNADRSIGQKAVVTEEINNLLGNGAAKINGVEWTARADSENIIPVGATVTVVRIDGVKLIVRN